LEEAVALHITTIQKRKAIMMNGTSMTGMAGWTGTHWLMMVLGAAIILVPF